MHEPQIFTSFPDEVQYGLRAQLPERGEPPVNTDLALLLARKMMATFDIGNYDPGVFDEPAEWESAREDAIAEVLRQAIACPGISLKGQAQTAIPRPAQ